MTESINQSIKISHIIYLIIIMANTATMHVQG